MYFPQDNNSNKLKNSFRSYEELKEELKDIEMNVTTDSEILKNLFDEFEVYEDSIVDGTLEKDQIDDIVQIFNDFEYLLHQVDNAQIFADMDGLVKIIQYFSYSFFLIEILTCLIILEW